MSCCGLRNAHSKRPKQQGQRPCGRSKLGRFENRGECLCGWTVGEGGGARGRARGPHWPQSHGEDLGFILGALRSLWRPLIRAVTSDLHHNEIMLAALCRTARRQVRRKAGDQSEAPAAFLVGEEGALDQVMEVEKVGESGQAVVGALRSIQELGGRASGSVGWRRRGLVGAGWGGVPVPTPCGPGEWA